MYTFTLKNKFLSHFIILEDLSFFLRTLNLDDQMLIFSNIEEDMEDGVQLSSQNRDRKG